MPQYIPSFPMSVAIFSNFICKGVVSIACSSLPRIFPTQLFFPTAIQTNSPSPVAIYVPDNKTGEGRSWGPFAVDLRYASSASFSCSLNLQFSRASFLSSSLSPVIAASLHWTPDDRIMMPSTGIFIPALILQISPTCMLLWWITSSYPFLITPIYIFRLWKQNNKRTMLSFSETA